MKITNEELYSLIKNNPGISVAEIARAMPITRVTVNEKVENLIAAGLVKKCPRSARNKGIPLQATGKKLAPSKWERVMLGKRAWTKEEDFLLEFMAQSMPIDLVVKKWPGNLLKCERKDCEAHWPNRTIDALRRRCRVLGVAMRPVMGLISMTEMAKQVGIDHSTLANWVKAGKLKALILGKTQKRRVFVTYKNLVEYFTSHPDSLNYFLAKGLDFEAVKEAADEDK